MIRQDEFYDPIFEHINDRAKSGTWQWSKFTDILLGVYSYL